jgi:hypothetical protein
MTRFPNFAAFIQPGPHRDQPGTPGPHDRQTRLADPDGNATRHSDSALPSLPAGFGRRSRSSTRRPETGQMGLGAMEFRPESRWRRSEARVTRCVRSLQCVARGERPWDALGWSPEGGSINYPTDRTGNGDL